VPSSLIAREQLGSEAESARILGYYTLCAMAISQGEVPTAAPKYVLRYPLVLCTLIGRLAIAKEQQGQRLGSILLADALLRAFVSAAAEPPGSTTSSITLVSRSAVGQLPVLREDSCCRSARIRSCE
jgi:hypothetical protein